MRDTIRRDTVAFVRNAAAEPHAKFSQMVWWIDRESAARAGAKIKSTKAETIAGVGSLTVIVSS
jgi:hypothetical protein